MQKLFRSVGNLLVLSALVLGASLLLRTGAGFSPAPEPVRDPDLAVAELSPTTGTTPSPVNPTPVTVAPAVATPTPESRLPITRLVIESIHLDTDVVVAPLVESNGAQTWQVPAFKAGHADGTAGAGQRGNAVLMGHISSLHSGDVFKDLDHVQVGDQVDVFSGERRFMYRVYYIRSVPRTDLAMVEPTPESIISLFTCTGVWDPLAWDFSERLFVRAALMSGA
jgi:LPXTG-site transpeptidase (sortase) family protein